MRLTLDDLCRPCPSCAGQGKTPHPSGVGWLKCERCLGRKVVITDVGSVVVQFLNAVGVQTDIPPNVAGPVPGAEPPPTRVID